MAGLERAARGAGSEPADHDDREAARIRNLQGGLGNISAEWRGAVRIQQQCKRLDQRSIAIAMPDGKAWRLSPIAKFGNVGLAGVGDLVSVLIAQNGTFVR